MVNKRQNILFLLTSILLATAVPVMAQNATLDLSPGFDRAQASRLGNTGSDLLLTDLAADLSTNVPAACRIEERYSSQQPDHLLNLPQELVDLRLTVNSNGKPTTLMVQDPQGRLYCGQPGSGFNEDSVLNRTHWDAGEYKVWVSGADAGQQYRLSARE
ncbi:MAG: hypothetical protein F6J87_04360 [Spirulina sp. SIO3F2]|nr:hypothetical protein [Spirulina sp. SIO3F2]